MVTSSLSALQSVESRCKGGDDVGSGICKSGGVPDGGVPDGDVSALVWRSMRCGGGSGDDHGESGDGGGVGIARSLATYVLD
ncbi:hypothetical protein Tco_0013994 [Tanacetum coccineum]